MAHESHPRFRVHHALRIKGFVKVENLAELAGLPEEEVLAHLQAMQVEGHTNFRENRGLWQLTPDGREAYVIALEEDVGRPGFREGLAVKYHRFLEMNEVFKTLCSDWQLRDGVTNDHSDAAYDEACIKRLGVLDDEAQPICHAFAEVAKRFDGYAARLAGSRTALEAGDTRMFTGVMCGSYHDVWMELHEDLLLTQGIDRVAEGSF
ncbi:MAG: MarR family transcriptional regulator [Ilumatobacteraceae bacterium]